MKIVELNLLNFGKFHNKKIIFNNKLNIIYGENEFGKTTIFKFIEGIFFGFVKPYLKSLRFNDDYYKYQPWLSNAYDGSIIFEYNEKIYKLYRNFSKKEYRIYDNISGNDIINTLNGYEASNLSFPGEYFFNCSSDIFVNTLMIGQGSNSISRKSTKYISEKVSDIITENNEVFSVVEGLNYLENLKNKIGTEKAKKKPLGILKIKEEKLKKKINDIYIIKDQYEKYIFDINNKQKEFYQLKNKMKLYGQYKKFIEQQKLIKILNNKDDLLTEIKNIEKEIEKYSFLKNISESDIKKVEYILDEIKYIQREFNELSKEKKIFYNKYNEYKEKIKYENKKLEYRNKIVNKNTKKNILKKIDLVLTILLFIIIILGLIFRKTILLFSIIPLSILLLSSFGVSIYIIAQERELIAEFNSKFNLNYNQKNFIIGEEYFKNNDLINEFNKLSNTIEIKDKNIEILLTDEELKREELNELSKKFRNNTGITIEQYLLDIEVLNDLERKLEYKYDNLKGIDSHYNLNKLKELENIEYTEEFEFLNEFDIDVAKEQSDYLIKSIASLEEKRNFMESDIIELPEYIEELENVTKKIAELEEYIEIIDVSISEINKANNEVKVNYLPRVAAFLKDYFSNISKYNLDLKVDEELNIVFSRYNLGEFKNIDDLSKGTMEQIYIGLRIVLANEMFSDEEFLIFDDAFNNFDDIRLKNMLYLLREYSEKRQIIIFTCQEREKNLLNNLQLNESIEL